MKISKILSFFFLLHSTIQANPFAIDFPEKKDLTNDDYVAIQNQVRKIDIDPILFSLYNDPFPSGHVTTLNDFSGRCCRGMRQNLIDPANGFLPLKEMIKVGSGGDRCIVCCVPYNGKYPHYIRTLLEGLKEQNYNGYFFYTMGGWPNPTGKEIKYVAVPYSFKIFAMVEAHRYGINNILWLDSACYPLKEIDELFKIIKKNGALLNLRSEKKSPKLSGYIFPKTRSLLKELTGTDVLSSNYVNTVIFGMNMSTPEAKYLVEKFYEFAEMGFPFLSCFPEEFVLSAIIGQNRFKKWRSKTIKHIALPSRTNADDSPKEFKEARKRGAYFYQRKGR